MSKTQGRRDRWAPTKSPNTAASPEERWVQGRWKGDTKQPRGQVNISKSVRGLYNSNEYISIVK